MNVRVLKNYLIDKGIISSVDEEVINLSKEDQYYSVKIKLSDLTKWVGIPTCPVHRSLGANGGAPNRNKAYKKALGESCERYCSAVYDPNKVVIGNYKQFENSALDPRLFPLFSTEQYKTTDFEFKPFSESEEIRWIPAHSIVHQKDILVPITLVHIPIKFLYPNERFMIPLATGIACGDTLEDAILKSILELIERDAVARMWFQKDETSRISYEKLVYKKNINILNYFDSIDSKLIANLITLDVKVPTIVCTIISKKSGYPAASFGISANMNLRECFNHSLEESLMSLINIKELIANKSEKKRIIRPNTIKNGEDRAIYYSDLNNLSKIDFLINSDKKNTNQIETLKSANDTSIKVAKLVSHLKNLGKDVIVVNLTTPELIDMGIWVVRTIIPGMQPLSPTYGYQHLGILQPENKSELKFNDAPHPFPVQPMNVFC